MITKQPMCPHCGTEHEIDKSESYHLYDTDDYEEVICEECEKPFFVKSMVTYEFETEKEIEDFEI